MVAEENMTTLKQRKEVCEISPKTSQIVTHLTVLRFGEQGHGQALVDVGSCMDSTCLLSMALEYLHCEESHGVRSLFCFI